MHFPLPPQVKNPKIAVLRGGTNRHKESIASGYGVLDSLARIEVPSVDVYIDQKGVWHTKGIETDPHKVFASVDGYVDTTEDKHIVHAPLARKMGVHSMLSHTQSHPMDRETVYRLLRQGGILVPQTEVIRVKNGISVKRLQEVWRALHTPYLIRPLSYKEERGSVFVSSFEKFKEVASEFADAHIDFHVVPYRSVQTISTALLPEYRGERIYTPLSVTTLVEHREVPHPQSKIIMFQTHDHEYESLRGVMRKAYEILNLNAPALIDVIQTKAGYMIVEVKTQPSLRSEGRFMQSLATTGVEIGHYVATRFHRD